MPNSGIWPIVLGGAPAAIAQAIYTKRAGGSLQYGSQSVPITQFDGSTFNVQFDFATVQPLYISFTIAAITGAFSATAIAAAIRAQFVYGINQQASASAIMAYVQSLYPNCYTSAEGVSLTNGSGYTAIVSPTSINYVFNLPALCIKINGTAY